MRKYVRRWMLAAALAAGGASALVSVGLRSHALAHAADSQPQQVATVEQLKAEAFRALRGGQFAKVNDLLGQAATKSNDPTLEKMVGWSKQFEDQRKEFADERNTQYLKAVEDVKKLQKAKVQQTGVRQPPGKKK